MAKIATRNPAEIELSTHRSSRIGQRPQRTAGRPPQRLIPTHRDETLDLGLVEPQPNERVRGSRPLLQRDAREDVLRQLSTARAPLSAEVADLCYDTTGLASSDAACQLGKLLVERAPRSAAAA